MHLPKPKPQIPSNSHFRTFSSLPFAERALLAGRALTNARPIETMEFSTLGGEKDHAMMRTTSHIREESSTSLCPKTPHRDVSKPAPKSLRFKLTVFFLCLISVIAAMDAVIVAACLAAIADSLKCTSIQAFWIGTSFLLAQTVTIPVYGTTSEIFGRKWVIITGISLFLIGSILCATAQNVNWLIGARVVQGIGAGGIVQLVQVILSDITTMEERAKYIAMSMAAWAVGTNIGVPIGGAIGEKASWRWIFWLNLPFCAISILGLSFSLNLRRDPSSFGSKLARVDWLGLGVFVSACTLFLAGITSGGVSAAWDSAQILAPMIIGGALFVAFIVIEWKVAKEPMMPLRIFNDRTAIAGFSSSFVQGLVVWCFIYYMVIFFLGALQHSLLSSAISTLSVGAFIAPSAIVASLIIKRTLHFKYIIIAGWVLLAAGMGLNVTMHPNSSKVMLYGPRCVAAIGAGVLMPTPLFAVQARQRDEDVGIATSTQIFLRSLGQTFGVALGGVIFQNRWKELLTGLVKAGHIRQAYILESNLAELGYELIRKMPQQVQLVYRGLYSDSLNMVWWVMVGISVLGLVGALVARNDELRGTRAGRQAFEDEEGDGREDVEMGEEDK